METLTIEYDVKNIAARQILDGLLATGVFRLKDKEIKKKNSFLSVHQLRGCAASSGFADKSDKEIKEIMYREKYSI